MYTSNSTIWVANPQVVGDFNGMDPGINFWGAPPVLSAETFVHLKPKAKHSTFENLLSQVLVLFVLSRAFILWFKRIRSTKAKALIRSGE